MMSSIPNQVGRNFVIFHPSDFSSASEVAFGHALKIALQAKGKLDIMHVEAHLKPEKAYWLDFPAVRATLAHWNILPSGVRREEVVKALLLARGLNCQTGEFRLIHVTTNSKKAPLIDLPLGHGWSLETILR